MSFFYWSLVAVALVLALSLVAKAGLLGWLPRLFGGALLWTGIWAVAAALRNRFLTSYPKWDPGNYVLDPLWDLILMFPNAAGMAWAGREAGLRAAISAALPVFSGWSGWNWPSDLSDLLHLTVSLAFALALISDQEAAKQSAAVAARPSGDRAVEGLSPQPTPVPTPRRPEEPNRSASLGPVDYRALVDPGSVRSVAVQIASPYPHTYAGALLRAAALFEHVKKSVNYVPDPIRMERGVMVRVDYVAHPAETLRIGGGDCDDQAVLMASLLSAVGIPNRLLLIGSTSNKYHLLTEFSIEASIGDQIEGLLESFYQQCGRQTRNRTYWRFKEGPRLWLLADTCSDYISNYYAWISSGFVIKYAKGEIRWHNCLRVC